MTRAFAMTTHVIIIGMFLMVSWTSHLTAAHVTPRQVTSYDMVVYESSAVLQHLVVNENARNIFIAGINRFERLSQMLQREDSFVTGPRTERNVSRDLHNKGLVLDLANRYILACSNLDQGMCYRHSLGKLAEVTPVPQPVVGSSVDPIFASTVLLRGQEQGSSYDSADGTLLVATSTFGFEGHSPVSTVPLFATRNLNTLQLAHSSSFWSVLPEIRTKIVHRAGYIHDNFAYFFSVRQTSFENETFDSHVSRVCVSDTNYRSLVEAPLFCDLEGVKYNVLEAAHVGQVRFELQRSLKLQAGEKVLYAVFSKSQPTGLNRTQDSALCVYRLVDIAQALQDAVINCHNGAGHLGPAHLWPPGDKCIKAAPVDKDYCGDRDTNYPVESEAGVSPFLSKAFHNVQLSAVVSSGVDVHSLVYLGTRSGQLLKVEIAADLKIVHYQTVTVARGYPILSDIYLTPDESYLYLLSTRKVLKMRMLSCNSSVTCDECLTTEDPHCGWCLSVGRCMSDVSCRERGSFWGWIPTRKAECPKINFVMPKSIHENTTVVVRVGLSFKPDIPINCALKYGSSYSNRVPVKRDRTAIICQGLQAPTLPPNTESVNASLELYLSHTVWLSTNVLVYSCAQHTNCTACSSSPQQCAWCSHDHLCTYDTNSCGSGFIYTQNASVKDRPHTGPSWCPRIKAAPEYEPLLHSGTVGTVRLRALNLQYIPISENTQLTCHLGDKDVNASLTQGNGYALITCGEVRLSYPHDSAFWSVPLAVSWGAQTHTLDNPDHVQLKLYNCEYMVTSCGQCLALDQRYNCGYCNKRCSIAANCPAGWRDKSFVCPDPHITRVSPLLGPVGGSTRLTVHGINLGHSSDDIRGGVTVAGQPCVVQDDHYEPSTSFVCLTGRSSGPRQGNVQVNVSTLYTAVAHSLYTYVDPVLESIHPTRGPQSGGTNITLSGRHLNVGDVVQVTFTQKRTKRQTDQTLQAHIYRRNETNIVFRSPQQSVAQERNVSVTIDGNHFLLQGAPFTFVMDPTVSTVSPSVASLSGGGTVEVIGERLKLVEKPRLVVYAGGQQMTTPCKPTCSKNMTCVMPDLRKANLGFVTMENPKQLPYGFLMDGVTSLLNLTDRGDLDPLIYYPDPLLTPLPEDLRYDGNKNLIINGEHMQVLKEVPNGVVLVGGTPCRNLDIQNKSISCTPPKEPHELSAGNAEVLVVLNGFRGSAGWLVYKKPAILGGKLPLVLGIVLGVAVPIIIVIIIIMCKLRRQNKMECQKLEKMRQSQMTIEDPAAMPLTMVRQVEVDVVMATERMPLRTEVLRSDEDGNHSEEDVAADRSEDTTSQEDQPPGCLHLNDVLNGITDMQLRKTIQEVLISPSQLDLGDGLGKGHFGCVYAGTLVPKDHAGREQKVAVKTLQAYTLDQDAVECFLKEGVMMRNFDHPHVLELLGVCLPEGEYPMVVLPFMANGDLRNYVKDKGRSFTARQLLHLAQQVAEGMAYLASLRFVHRDLAARNCMIDDTNNVKVADFGLSRHLYDRDHYFGTDKKKKMPIKWMAIESLEEYIFTTKSDVWSFGILMWELLTRGVTPYPDVDVFEIRNYLATGRRLRQPKFCPDHVYAIMVECWMASPKDRPTFADLVNQLELIINPPKTRESGDSFDEPLYVNIKRPASVSDCLEKGT